MYGIGYIFFVDVFVVRGYGVSDAEQEVGQMVCLSFQECFLEE